MRDLDDVVEAGLEERERRIGAAPSGVLDRVARRVRRNRVRRHAVQGVAVVVAAAVVGGAGWWGAAQRHVPQPALTPPVVTSATTTPTPTPSVTPSAAALATAVLPARLGLPTLHALPDDVWSRTGAGWALGIYRSQRWRAMPATYDPSTVPGIVNTLVLAAPDGTLYDVRDLDEVVNVAAWQAGTTQAELQDGRMLDLRTGVIGADRHGVPDGARFEGTGSDGSLFWTAGSRQGDLYRGVPGGSVTRLVPGKEISELTTQTSPDGHWLLGQTVPNDGSFTSTLGLYDLVTGATTVVPYGVAGDVCKPVGWTSATRVLAECVTTSYATDPARYDLALRARQQLAQPVYALVDVSDGGATVVQKPDAVTDSMPLTNGTYVSDGAVAFLGGGEWESPYGCPTGVYRWQDGRLTTLLDFGDGPDWSTLQSVGGATWIDQDGYCSGDATPDLVTAVAPDGSSHVVFPVPPEEDGEGADVWAQALTSWAVAQ